MPPRPKASDRDSRGGTPPHGIHRRGDQARRGEGAGSTRDRITPAPADRSRPSASFTHTRPDRAAMAEHSQAQLRTLLRVAKSLNGVRRPELVMRVLVRAGMRLCGATAGAAGLMSDGQMVFTEQVRGRKVRPLSLRFPLGKGIPGRVIRTKGPYTCNNPGEDRRLAPDLREALEIRNLINMPVLTASGDLLGCVELHNTRDGRPFDRNDTAILRALAELGAGALIRSLHMQARERAEAELSRARRDWENIFQAIEQPAMLLDGELRVIRVNRAMARISRRAGREIIGKRCPELFADAKGACDPCPLDGAASRKPRPTQIGVEAWGRSFLISCTPICGRNGRLERVIHIATDITDRRSAEQATAEARDYLEAIVGASQDGILVIDAEGRIEFANRASLNILGWPEKEILGAPVLKFIPEDLRDSVLVRWAEVQAEGSAPYEVEIAQKDGDRRSLLVNHRHYHTGGARKYCVVAKDVTERKRAEAARTADQIRAQRFLQIAGVVMIAIDPDQRVTLVNQKTCETLGCSEEEIVGRNWFDTFIPTRERERVREAFKRLMAGDLEPIEYFENPILSRDGSERIILWHNTILRDDKGRITGTLSSGTDITDRKLMENQLRALNETLEQRVTERTAVAEESTRQLRVLAGQLLEAEMKARRRVADLLHEHFQQMLVAARMRLGLARGRSTDGELLAELARADQILEQAVRESRTLAVQLSPPVLHELGLGPALDWLSRWMREMHGLAVEVREVTDVEPDAASVRALVFESIRELLFNVVKHAQVERAWVEVSRTPQGWMRVVVQDEGAGFDPDHRPRDSGSEVQFGLFSIRERIESLGGHMEIESRPGHGTRVVLQAPAKQAAGLPQT